MLSIAALVMGLVCSSFGQSEPTAVTVPDINGKATLLVRPDFPKDAAVAATADGNGAQVKIRVNEAGLVESAVCPANCHPSLRDAAELAARQSTFQRLLVEGRPTKYEGILIYNFVVNRVDWLRFGTSLESARQFDNLSLGPVASMLPDTMAAERDKLLALDKNGGPPFETRQRVIGEVEATLRSRLSGDELFQFDVGSAVRGVSMWVQSRDSIHRSALEKSLRNLRQVLGRAPKDLSPRLLKALKALGDYTIRMDISEGDLRTDLAALSRAVMMRWSEVTVK